MVNLNLATQRQNTFTFLLTLYVLDPMPFLYFIEFAFAATLTWTWWVMWHCQPSNGSLFKCPLSLEGEALQRWWRVFLGLLWGTVAWGIPCNKSKFEAKKPGHLKQAVRVTSQWSCLHADCCSNYLLNFSQTLCTSILKHSTDDAQLLHFLPKSCQTMFLRLVIIHTQLHGFSHLTNVSPGGS